MSQSWSKIPSTFVARFGVWPISVSLPALSQFEPPLSIGMINKSVGENTNTQLRLEQWRCVR